MIINVIGKVHNSCDCLNLLNTITQVSTLRLFVTGIIKLCIVLISGSPCPDDGTPRKDAPEGEYTLTVRIVYFFFFGSNDIDRKCPTALTKTHDAKRRVLL